MYRLQPDQAQRFLHGALAGAVGALLSVGLGAPDLGDAAAIAFAAVIGIARKVSDKRMSGAAEKVGLAAPHESAVAGLRFTVLGAVPVALPFIMMRFVHG